MKYFLVLFIIFFTNQHILYAQVVAHPYKPKIDSVQQLLTTYPIEDTTKVKHLNDLALLCLFDMQFERGMLAANQALQLSQKLNYPKGEGLYLNFMRFMSGGGTASYYYYYYKKTLFYADIKEKEEPNKLIELFPTKREPEKVIVKLLEALKYYEKNNDKKMMAHILGAIGANYQMLNKTNENIQYTDRAIKLFKETGQPELALLVSFNKILSLQTDNKTKEANEVENDAKAILVNIKDIREGALLNFAIGNLYIIRLNKTAIGFEYMLKADYELEKIGDKNLRIILLHSLAESFDNIGLHHKSLDGFKKVIGNYSGLSYESTKICII